MASWVEDRTPEITVGPRSKAYTPLLPSIRGHWPTYPEFEAGEHQGCPFRDWRSERGLRQDHLVTRIGTQEVYAISVKWP